MKPILNLLAVIGLALAFSAGARSETISNDDVGKRTISFRVEGVMREVIVYRPAHLPADRQTPVVFVFHGTGGSGEHFYEESGWKEKADSEGFMVVYPTALKYHTFQETLVKHGQVLHDVSRFVTKWNFFGLEMLLDPAYPDQHLYDDVRFVQAIVGLLRRNYAVDETRFYVTGFSNGGQFAGRLAVQMSDVFAAFTTCAIGRAFNEEQAALTNVYTNAPFQPRPVMQVIGELDPKLTYAAGVEAFPLDESAAAPGTWAKDYVINSWLGLLGLPDQYQFTRTPAASLFTFNGQAAAGIVASPEYRLVIVKGMKHVYPNGENFGFDVVDYFWPFMQRYRR
ncbi:MAG TPA: hypothetical protein VFD58_23890 [Blastocatellia bacterium]|nr:hypothetical protein [Blastocatellia bacterium]